MAIRTLIADDSDAMRTAIQRVLEEDARIKVVGGASTFVQVMQMIEKCEPQVLLLDLHMRGRVTLRLRSLKASWSAYSIRWLFHFQMTPILKLWPEVTVLKPYWIK